MHSFSRKLLPTSGETANRSSTPLQCCFSSTFWSYVRNFGILLAIFLVLYPTEESSPPEANVAIIQPAPPSKSQDTPKKLSLRLLGERHSGTNWMGGHLEDCFGQDIKVRPRYAAWKHWRQKEEAAPDDAVIVAQFRNVYHWVEAMRFNPYHAPNHFDLEWLDFVTKPWTMRRYGTDVAFEGISKYNASGNSTAQCKTNPAFKPYEVIPCNAGAVMYKAWNGQKQRKVDVLYELRNDGSGEPFEGILQLRSAKIQNHLSVANFERVHGFFPVRYEDMVENGTEPLIRQLEEILGVTARCDPVPGTPITKHRPLFAEYIDYLQAHVDWETEALVGFTPDMI